MLSTATKLINDYSNNNNILEVLKACWRIEGIEKKCTNCEFRSLEEFMHERIIANFLKILLASNAGLWSCVSTNPHTLSSAQFLNEILAWQDILCRKCKMLLTSLREVVLFMHELWRCHYPQNLCSFSCSDYELIRSKLKQCNLS